MSLRSRPPARKRIYTLGGTQTQNHAARGKGGQEKEKRAVVFVLFYLCAPLVTRPPLHPTPVAPPRFEEGEARAVRAGARKPTTRAASTFFVCSLSNAIRPTATTMRLVGDEAGGVGCW